MKNYITLLLLSFALFSTSCQKSSLQIPDLENEDQNKKFAQIEVTPSRMNQILIFNQLSNEEKFTLWIRHIKRIEKNSISELTVEKKMLLEELKRTITKDIFDESSNASMIFQNYTMPIWIGKAEKYFNAIEINNLVFYIGAEKLSQTNIYSNRIEDDLKDCWCKSGSSGFSCTKVTVGTTTTIEYGICELGSINCKSTSGGCGYLWLSNCTGNHCSF